MIGTHALQYCKIFDDYGVMLKSGATALVTLDTDAGTLSFGLQKDSSTMSSLSVVPLVQNVVSSLVKLAVAAGTSGVLPTP